MNELTAGFLVFNAFVFLVYAHDKWKARRGLWRTPESVLLGLAALGGGAGAALAVYLLRHKRRKPLFAVGVPLLLALQLLLAFRLCLGWLSGAGV